MKITIEGEPEEIAVLVLEIQGRREKDKTIEFNIVTAKELS